MSSGPIDTGAQISRSEIMLVHNKERSIRGVPQLRYDPTLQDRAQKWAESMAKHDNLVHSHLDMQGTKFTYMGENIAMGYADIDSVIEGWMNSSGHRRNILSKNFTHAGFGYAKAPNGPPYWCAQFGGK
jgi:uncharacterized protein YkwD